MPLQDIVSARSEKKDHVPISSQIFQIFKTSAELSEILPEPLEISELVGSVVGCLCIHFVKEEKEEGMLKLKEVVILD